MCNWVNNCAGTVKPDNNAVERAIRPITLGRKNLRIAISFLGFISTFTFLMTGEYIYLIGIISYGSFLFAFAMFLDTWESKKIKTKKEDVEENKLKNLLKS